MEMEMEIPPSDLDTRPATMTSNCSDHQIESEPIDQEIGSEDVYEDVGDGEELDASDLVEIDDQLASLEIEDLYKILREEETKNEELRTMKIDLNQTVRNGELQLHEQKQRLSEARRRLEQDREHCQSSNERILSQTREIDELLPMSSRTPQVQQELDQATKALENLDNKYLEERIQWSQSSQRLNGELSKLRAEFRDARPGEPNTIEQLPDSYFVLDRLRDKIEQDQQTIAELSDQIERYKSINQTHHLADGDHQDQHPDPNSLPGSLSHPLDRGSVVVVDLEVPDEVISLREANAELENYILDVLNRLISIPYFERLLDQAIHLTSHVRGDPCPWEARTNVAQEVSSESLAARFRRALSNIINQTVVFTRRTLLHHHHHHHPTPPNHARLTHSPALRARPSRISPPVNHE